MSHKSAWLVKRVKIDGKWTTKPPVFNKKMLTNKIIVDGEHRVVPGTYVLEWYDAGKRERKTVGTDPTKAHLELQYMERRLADLAEGRAVVETPTEKRHSYDLAVADYIAELREKRREPKTIRGIEQALEFFKRAIGATYLDSIKKEDVTRKYVRALREPELQYADQTIFDRYARMVAFFNFCAKHYGLPRLVELQDGPERPRAHEDDDGGRKDPFTEEELAKLFAICTPQENLLWQFFLQTGCRERELMFATWKDIDLKSRVFKIRGKETNGLKFRTKNRKSRTVPFGQSLADALQLHQQSQPKGTLLVFPDKDGKPWFHIIRILKKRAFEAGLNCGHCVTKRRKDECATAPVCELYFLHRFRHSFACLHIRNGVDLRTLQLWMGHQEMETTTIYLSKIRNASDSTKALVDATFAGMDAALKKPDTTPTARRAAPTDDDDDEVAEAAFLTSFAGPRIPRNPALDTKAGQIVCKE
jgi:integrase